MSFNNIKMTHSHNTCNLEGQHKIKDLQSSAKYWRQHNTNDYIAFCGQSHCAVVSTVAETIQASSATADRNYTLAVVPNAEYLGLSIDPGTQYISERINFFSSGVIPRDIHERQLRNLDEVLKLWENGLQSATQLVSLSQGYSDSRKLTDEVLRMWERGLQSASQLVSLSQSYSDSSEYSLEVDKEVQFNKWLFKMISQELQPHGFKVEDNRLNKSIIPNCCEFSNSRADAIIYHPSSLVKSNVNGLTIVIHSDSSSDSDVDVEDIDGIEKVATNGCTFEMKSESVSEAAINECVYNMFGASSRLVTWVLEMGKVVETANMYGVVAAMGSPDEVVILKLSMDFKGGMCNFKVSDYKYKFRDAVNTILHHLNS